MKDYIIIIPTHNRHEYLPRIIKYYAEFPCHVYMCDSTPIEFIPINSLPSNIHYNWYPNKGFYDKVHSILTSTNAKFYNLTPDDDFLNLNTVQECYELMKTNPNISLSTGKQVSFNKPYDGRFYSFKSANLMYGLQLGKDRINNAVLFGKHYQNILWSIFRHDVILSAFNKLNKINPNNANFIELTLALEACVNGEIYISSDPLNYREYSIEEHWGKQVKTISVDTLSSDVKMKSDLDKIIKTYQDGDRIIVNAFIEAYFKLDKHRTISHLFTMIKNHFFRNNKIIEETPYSQVEQIILS